MSTLDQLRDGLSKAWDSITDGWRELRELASDAITRFHPPTEGAQAPSVANRASRWGLLAAEVAVSDDEVEVTLEIPGLEPHDFNVEVVDGMLVVRGEKKVVRSEVRGRYQVTERAYGHFERAIRLPCAVDDTHAEARYHAGVLSLTLPKHRSSKVRRITVNG